MNKLVIGIIVTLVLLIGSCVTTHLVTKTPIGFYSEGQRTGIIRKFSNKGFIYKTWEGELMMNIGFMKPDTFLFSTIEDSIINKIQQNIGEEVTLHYKQYIIVPYRCGSTSYLVHGITN